MDQKMYLIKKFIQHKFGELGFRKRWTINVYVVASIKEIILHLTVSRFSFFNTNDQIFATLGPSSPISSKTGKKMLEWRRQSQRGVITTRGVTRD